MSNKIQYIIDEATNTILELSGNIVNLYRYGQYSLLYYDKKKDKADVDLRNKKDLELLTKVLGDWLHEDLATKIGTIIVKQHKSFKNMLN